MLASDRLVMERPDHDLIGTAGKVESWNNFLQRTILRVTFNDVASDCKGQKNLLNRGHWFRSITLSEVKRKPS